MPLHLPGSLANVKAVMGERRFRGEHLVYIMQQGAIGLVKLHRFTNTGTDYTKPLEQGLATKGPERRGYTQPVDCYSLASTVVDSAVSHLPP
ncbi:hypothetical protein AAVH_34903, partial [Aphelenchoides avenae]